MSRVAATAAALAAMLAGPVLAGPAQAGPGLAYAAQAGADDVRDAQWQLDALGVAVAHAYSRGDGVTVAVLDSGVDASHPDLRENVLPGVDLTDRAGGGSDGRDDPGGSGTALAGLIAGHGHGGTVGAGPDGILGLAPRAALLPVVVAAPGASPAAGVLAAGIDEAVRLGADVLCIGRPLPDHPAVTRALAAALADGALVVVPGRTGGDALARFQGAGLLGAVPLDTPPGAGTVAVPADGVVSTGGQGGYYRYARTAEAAASGVLAGAAALVRAAYPELSGYEASHRIAVTAEAGELRLVDALTVVVGPAPEPPAPPAGAPSPAPPGEPEPEPVPPGQPEPEPPPVTRVAAFDADDWRRRLVAVPLVVFLAAAAAISLTAARRSRR
jgi:hypothetical protein